MLDRKGRCATVHLPFLLTEIPTWNAVTVTNPFSVSRHPLFEAMRVR
jgi:hypothetical protein